MSDKEDQIKENVLSALKNTKFVPADLTSKYSSPELAQAITRIVDDKRMSDYSGGTDLYSSYTINLSETELQNLYFLTRTLLTGELVRDREKVSTNVVNKKKKELFPSSLLNSMYRLHPSQ